jgi:Flp pilus assembly protein TadD
MGELDAAGTTDRAALLCGLDRADQAVSLLHRALAGEPGHAALWRHLAYAHIKLRQPDQALAAAQQAVALEPEEEWGHRLASVAYGQLKRHPEAVAAAREATRLAPTNWRTQIRLAETLRAVREHDEAATALARARELAPHEPEVALVAGVLWLARRDVDGAEAEFRRALQLDPTSGEAIHNLALIDRIRGRFGLAAAKFGAAVAANPRLHSAAAAAREALRTLVLRILLFTTVCPALLTLLGTVGRNPPTARYRVLEPLLVLAPLLVPAVAWYAFRQLPRHLRPHARALAARSPLIIAAAAVSVLAELTLIVWAFAVWVAPPGAVFWVLGPCAVLGAVLLTVQARCASTSG